MELTKRNVILICLAIIVLNTLLFGIGSTIKNIFIAVIAFIIYRVIKKRRENEWAD